MAHNQNQVVTLARRPQGKPRREDFEVKQVEVRMPGDGEILIQTLYLSVDPGMRGMMDEAKSYSPGFKVGQPLTGRSVGRVVISNHPDFTVGDYVHERLAWQHYSVSDGRNAKKLDPEVAPLSTYWRGRRPGILRLLRVEGNRQTARGRDHGCLRVSVVVGTTSAAGLAGAVAWSCCWQS